MYQNVLATASEIALQLHLSRLRSISLPGGGGTLRIQAILRIRHTAFVKPIRPSLDQNIMVRKLSSRQAGRPRNGRATYTVGSIFRRLYAPLIIWLKALYLRARAECFAEAGGLLQSTDQPPTGYILLAEHRCSAAIFIPRCAPCQLPCWLLAVYTTEDKFTAHYELQVMTKSWK